MLLTSYRNDIQDDTLNTWLDCLESSKQIIILDSCRSGGFIEELERPGRVVLTSCNKNEDAWEFLLLEHSVFTYYILDALNHFDEVNDNNDNSISIKEVFKWAEARTVSYTTDYASVQHPQSADGFSGQISLNDFVSIAFDMNPQASFITIDGIVYSASKLPITFTWQEGTSHQIAVHNSLDDNGTEYTFDSWNDGNTLLTRMIEASDNASYIANYKQIGAPIWPYVTGASVIVIIIALVILRKRILPLKRARERVGRSTAWEARDKQGISSAHYELTITYEEARIGTKKVLTRRGRRLEVVIPSGVTNGSLVRLNNALHVTDGVYGDILIIIKLR